MPVKTSPQNSTLVSSLPVDVVRHIRIEASVRDVPISAVVLEYLVRGGVPHEKGS